MFFSSWFSLSPDELIFFGIAGAILTAMLWTDVISPITARLVAFAVGVIFLTIATIEVITRHN